MNDVIKIPDDQKIFSMQELEPLGFSQYKIRNLARDGRLERLSKSYYENTGYKGEESDFYYVKAYAPEGVICLLSAAVYYNLTTYIPDAVDVAIPGKARISLMPDWPAICVHYYTDERFKLGIREMRDGKNEFRIYDIEKTVTDIVFYREQVGIEETREILTSYLQREDRNLNQLLRYSNALKCSETMRKYLEVLV